jgi:hypothetical protein
VGACKLIEQLKKVTFLKLNSFIIVSFFRRATLGMVLLLMFISVLKGNDTGTMLEKEYYSTR